MKLGILHRRNWTSRNQHDIIKDFESEIPRYLKNENLCNILQELNLEPRKSMRFKDLYCYKILIETEFFPKEEFPLVGAGIRDVRENLH